MPLVTSDNIRQSPPDQPAVQEPEGGNSNDFAFGGGTVEDEAGESAIVVPDQAANFAPNASEESAQRSVLAMMKQHFAKQKKVSVFVPEGRDEHVQVNGYSFVLKAGEQVEVPIQIAEMLHVSWRGRATANKVRQIGTQTY